MIFMSKYDVLLQYIFSERIRLSDDITALQDNIRYRNISTVDCLELIIAKERYSAFCEFADNVQQLLRIGKYYDRSE